MALLQISHLNFTYPNASQKALNDIDFSLEEGKFAILFGRSGCGKSTLLRQIKKELAPFGKKSGSVLYDGTDIVALPPRRAAAEIGFVMQNPDSQIVTHEVWHELAFGLENLGIAPAEIHLRVAETASFFGIEKIFRRNVDELSGGQKQLLNLASALVLQPRLLILDEPTSQLDPSAARELLETVGRVNRELGVTVLLTEHRLEYVFPLADKVAVMEEGRLLCNGSLKEAADYLARTNSPLSRALPSAMRIAGALGNPEKPPVTVRDGRLFLRSLLSGKTGESLSQTKTEKNGVPALEAKELWLRYSKNGEDILRGLSVRFYSGLISCILGGNGAGKTTLLRALCGLLRPMRGTVLFRGKPIRSWKLTELYQGNLAFLPQNPQALFTCDTLVEDLKAAEGGKQTLKEELRGIAGAEPGKGEPPDAEIRRVAEETGVTELLSRHPFDLSGGEQQKAAIAKLLLRKPRILLLDEPTKGLDAEAKSSLASLLRRICESGAAVVMVTHDIEFAAEYSDECSLIFDGTVVSGGDPKTFFAGNNFYTTAANRMARGILPGAVTCGDVIEQCKKLLNKNEN